MGQNPGIAKVMIAGTLTRLSKSQKNQWQAVSQVVQVALLDLFFH